MAFFDEIGRKITETGQTAIQKTKNLAEIGKLNDAIAEEEKRMNAAYLHIGQQYFELNQNNQDDVYSSLLSEIKGGKTRVAEWQEQIRKLKGVTTCPACSAEIQYGASFCSTCGQTITSTQQPVITGGSTCGRCGNQLAADDLFCTSCGTKVENEAIENKIAKTQCSNCGMELNEGAGFCTGCGTRVGE